MHSLSNIFALAPISILLGVAEAQVNGIDIRDKIEEMEHILVDNNGTNSDGFMNAVTPCLNYVGFGSNGSIRGEQSSAQWVRAAFHDFVTADLSAGTGGIDASLGFESNREENEGLFINDTLQFFSPTVSAYMSMSDNIALGVIASVAECGGTNTGIVARTGRIDAEEAGPSGVPGPFTDLKTTLAQFESAGFNQADTIALTACGHSLGRVHYSNFPTIVDESYVTSTNLDGEPFDTTPGVFDAAVVTEYLDGTGSLGGPLVTSANVSGRSDYRLYTSDSNATIESISTETTFQSTCNALFQRMIDTVPSTVTLSDPITPMTWKGVDLMLDTSSTGEVSISGLIRNLYTDTLPAETVEYTITSSSGDITQTSDTTSGNGTSIYGSTIYYPFNSSISTSATSITISSSISYPIDTSIFILPLQSSVNSTTDSFTIRAAALTSLVSSEGSDMMGVLYVPTSVQGTVTKKIVNETVSMSEVGTMGNYTLFEGTTVAGQSTSVVLKVVLGSTGSKTVKSDILVGGN